MNTFENIGKKMPYTESDDYVNALVEQTTEQTLRQAARPQAKTGSLHRWAIAATVTALLGFGALTWLSPATGKQVADNEQYSPVDDFLNRLSDDEAQLLAYYEIEDIPEYE